MFTLSSQSPEFLSSLPASARSPAAAVASDAAERSHTAPAQAQLLYIEDNPVNQLVVQELVALRPVWQLSLAGDGQQGLARAASLRPDLILLDLELPDMNGFQVLEALRADPATASIPCIALSASAMPDDLRRAQAAGFAEYWTKPVDFKAFHAGLDQFLTRLKAPGQ